MAVPVIMPRQGQSVETCIITQWMKHKGDTVKEGDILFSYETDKASFDVESPAGGILLDVFFSDGDEVPVLVNVAVIGKEGEDIEQFRSGTPKSEPEIPAVEETPDNTATGSLSSSGGAITGTGDGKRTRISPRARIMAEKMGVDTQLIAGTGPNGRIIARDIENASKQTVARQPEAPAFTANAEYEDTKLSNVRKIIARAMHESISQSAQLTHHMSADARKILGLRARFKSEFEKGSKFNITLNDMICFAVIRALEKHPAVNGHFFGDTIRLFKNVHLGLAVDTPRGLMVPAIQNAGHLSLNGLSARLREVADQCRKGNIDPGLLSSEAASFTVSNLGNYGVEMFTPIINLPQMAILGVNTITHRPADLGNGVFGFIPVVGLSLTYDHRAIDGGPATLFLREIKEEIENFQYV